MSVLGNWLLSYRAVSGDTGSYAPDPNAYTANTAPGACVDYAHPGNLAADDLSHLGDFRIPRPFDFDGDGNEEIFLAVTTSQLQDHPESSGVAQNDTDRRVLLSYRRGKIESYKPAATVIGDDDLAGLDDVDKDGRPDLLITFFGIGEKGGALRRVAHSLPDGTFTTEDAAAKAAERAQCPKVASALVVSKPGGTPDESRSREAAACAILGGESERDVENRLSAECEKLRPRGCATLLSWARELTARAANKKK